MSFGFQPYQPFVAPPRPVAAAPRPAPKPRPVERAVATTPPEGYRFKVIVPPPGELGIVLPE